jgi:hypothetical protein
MVHKGGDPKIVHDSYLEKLVTNLHKIKEDIKDIKWIMKDGIWMKDQSEDYNLLCDLIVVFYSGYGVPIELKGNKDKRLKAKKQILSGKKFIEEVLNLPVPRGKFVVYTPKGLYWYKQFDFKI